MFSSALFAALLAVASATPLDDMVAALRLAPTQVERIGLLKNDADFVFNFLDQTHGGVVTGAGGHTVEASSANFPAVIGNGMAMTVGFVGPCAINSPHTHPRATEFNLIINGTLHAGFLAENGARFVVNDVPALSATIFPKGAIHFEANLGCDPVMFVAGFNDEDPGVLQIAQRFFGLPPDIVGASLGGLGVEVIAQLAGIIPDNIILGAQECQTRCGLAPVVQPTSQQQPRVSGNALPSATGTYAPPTTTSAPVNHDVMVGADGLLKYTPPTIAANPGDTVTFHYVAKNHTATQSSFDKPCDPLPYGQGFDSGFEPVYNGTTTFPTFQITVKDTKPIWVHCAQTVPASHCGQGMVFAVNAPAQGNTFDKFQAAALATGKGSSSSASTSKSGWSWLL